MRRALLSEPDIDRLLDLAREAGQSFRVLVDADGEASFVVPGLGEFDNTASLERALADIGRRP